VANQYTKTVDAMIAAGGPCGELTCARCPIAAATDEHKVCAHRTLFGLPPDGPSTCDDPEYRAAKMAWLRAWKEKHPK
jgi:hypothetical protein